MRTPVLLHAGRHHLFVFRTLTKGDILLSMGADDFGDRGVGGLRAAEIHESCSSVGISHLLDDEERLFGILKILDIKAGTHNVLVKLACRRIDGSSKIFFVGWGTSRHGQLSQNVTSPITASPVAVPIQDAQDVISFAVGNHHSVFVYSSGRVLALGSDRKMQREGLGSIDDAHSVGTTWNGTYVLRDSHMEDWRIYATGSNSKGQLASQPSDPCSHEVVFGKNSSAREIVCGSEHILVHILPTAADPSSDNAKEEIWGWGWNEHGNLGLGHVNDIHEPRVIWPSASCPVPRHRIHGVWAGLGTSWIAIEYDSL